MNSLESEILPNDLLFHIERKIARRADELSRFPNPSSLPLDHWWQAEREIWDHEDLVTSN
ncbi:MAG TPA: hypothetical protein VHO24_05000 [Opitutaceae bacterium]|nr:hypothetical protein [Opitutaceae bacterium]